MRKIRAEIEKLIDLLEELNQLIGDLSHVHSEQQLACLNDKIINCKEQTLFEIKYLKKRIEEFL